MKRVLNRSIQKTIDYYRKWQKKNGQNVLERELKYFQADLEDGTDQAFQQIPDSLSGFATFFGIRGVVRILDGIDDGWEDVSTSLDFRGWELRIRAELFLKRVGNTLNLTNYTSRAASLVCVSEKWKTEAERVLLAAENQPNAVDQPFWTIRRFEPFVLNLCRFRTGMPLSFDRLTQPYLSVIEAWDDQTKLDEALVNVCDYHCDNMFETDVHWDPEFKYAPFELIPCEWILIRRIRNELGLRTPDISHELLDVLGMQNIVLEDRDFGVHEFLRELEPVYRSRFA